MSSRINEERVALVTGGTQGIGRAVCRGLAERGYRVLFVGRNPAYAEAVLAELRECPGELEHTFISADLSLLSETARVAAARTPVYLATQAATPDTNGRFFGPKLRELPVPARARRVDRRRALWGASETLVKDFV